MIKEYKVDIEIDGELLKDTVIIFDTEKKFVTFTQLHEMPSISFGTVQQLADQIADIESSAE